ncbi:MAG: recombination protein O N-terminal domain-containing protein [Candidatus Paceibacterota bacterium]|jgi:recombinational DNA repair protein (RecF pathway)
MATPIEYYTRALVLDRTDVGEKDAQLDLFTERYGKMSARARSIRAIRSKLSAHLQPLHFVRMRLAPRTTGNGFVVIDSVLDDVFVPSVTRRRADCADIVRTLNMYASELDADHVIWHALEALFGDGILCDGVDRMKHVLLSRMGFDPRYASCTVCGARAVTHFVISHGTFVCASCSLSLPQNEVLYFI